MCKKLICLTSFVVVLALAGNAVGQLDPADVTDGHVYLFDDVGGNLTDDSTNSNAGNLIGSPQVVAGLKGNALQFNGTSDGVHLPDSAMIGNTGTHQNRTVIAVFNCADVTKSDKQVVFEEGGYTRGLTIYVHDGLAYGAGWNKGGDYSPEWSPGAFISAPIGSNEWHAVALVIRDGAAGQEDDKFEMWMDGELIGKGPGGELRGHSNDNGLGYAKENVVFHDGNGNADGHYFEGMIDEVWILNQALTQVELSAWRGKPWPLASGPTPADGAYFENTWGNLFWKPGAFAVSHDLYMGENLYDVDNGTGDTFVGNQSTMDIIVGFPGFPFPDGLVPGTTYYWRIDEVNEKEPNSPWKGDIWSFSVPPRTAYAPIPADGGESVALDVELNWTGGFEAKLHTVYFGDNFDDVSNAAGGALLGDPFFTPPGPLEFAKTYYWRVDEFDPPFTHKGEVWSFTAEGTAANPYPAKGAVDASPTPILRWTPGSLVASHEVYFGADADAVKSAGMTSPEHKASTTLGEESYDAGRLELETTYYWRIDEVNAATAGSPWIGNVWSFTTGDFLVVDDFESYDDVDPLPGQPGVNRIFDKWIDGFGTLTNGALIGNALPPYAETTIVHGGAQSMNYAYDNANKTSEATLTLVYPKDWTEEGVTRLSLWMRGSSANAADRIFAALGNAVVYHEDPAATQLSGWNEWVIDLTAFAGVNLTNVNSIAIGIGTRGTLAAGGTGTMYFDDIRLIR